MLKNYLTSVPFTKFIVIEDTLQERGKPVFDFILKSHLDRLRDTIHYFVFQENFIRTKGKFGQNNVILYDFASNSQGWNQGSRSEDFEETVKKLGANDVVFVDSLAHVIYQYGLAETYRVFNYLRNHTSVQQTIALLHQDLLLDKIKANLLFDHLCTLSLSLKPKFISDNGRLQYTFKKLGGKIIREVEEYWFDHDNLLTKKIDKLDPKMLLETSTPKEVNPETLTTFKIGLSDKEKESRDNLVLPYLPKSDDQSSTDGGKIFYQFDEVDDWDEEDPDDDLDI
ncbi:hypothetical protein JTB14_007216 [Gonioctena quinquepunctata]|nr:hypothetical protein JTB14_007216 [Gonioctena quinquepunctata]